MPRRIIIHAGFHKTGTSTLQATLRENRTALKKHVALRLRWHLRDALAAARSYSTNQDPLALVKLQTRFGDMVNALPGMPRRTLVISAEELAGHLPGRPDVADYGAAPVLIYAYWEILAARYPKAEIMVYLSTRAPDAWLASAHWEHVKASTMTMDLDTFRDRFAAAADLDRIAQDIASRVPAPVHTHALEQSRDMPLGPAEPLLSLCDLPLTVMAALTPAAPANQRPDRDVVDALIAINRDLSDPEARTQAKAAVLAEANAA